MSGKRLPILFTTGIIMTAILSGCSEVKEAPVETTKNVSVTTAETTESISVEKDDTKEFYISEITDEIFERIEGKSYKYDCPLPLEDLSYLHVLHKDIDGAVHEGELIVNKMIAEDILDIFYELYENEYPIEKMKLIDEYDADDELSMEDNNSSGFNYRLISNSNNISKHGYGLALDINPLYNPYINDIYGETIIEPENAEVYTDRSKDFDYKIEKGDLCYRAFIRRGFKWGGDWDELKDYQHFEVSDEAVKEWYPG